MINDNPCIENLVIPAEGSLDVTCTLGDTECTIPLDGFSNGECTYTVDKIMLANVEDEGINFSDHSNTTLV